VARLHLTHLNPFPANLGELLGRFDRAIVPEMNLGQLTKVLRAEFLLNATAVTKVRGLPFTAVEIETAILDALGVDQGADQ
jgi:2-oxoglutarate/2-oxoacid ferredoxin oxidoreductase subunit alpha